MIKTLLHGLRRATNLGSLLLFVYLLAFVRQCWWPMANPVAAWAGTALVTLVIWYLVNSLRATLDVAAHPSRSFVLIVVIPLLAIYLARAAFPDGSFDVLNYHVMGSARSLHGYPYLPGDFLFPMPGINPLPDMIAGMFRFVLGYRLGTILNLLVMLWTGLALKSLLADWLGKDWQCSLAILLILLVENVLFLMDTYMVDLVAVPLLVEATVLTLKLRQTRDAGRACLYISILAGLAVAVKMVNLVFVAPILLAAAYMLLVDRRRPALVWLGLSLAALLLPSVPFALIMYAKFQSPTYPFFNAIFRSPYSLTVNVKDPHWGPRSLFQTLVWPVLILFEPSRASEMPSFAGSLTLGYCAAILYLPFRRIEQPVRVLSFIVLTGSLLWSLSTGYIRYGVYLEIMSGVLIIFAYRLLSGWLRPPEPAVPELSTASAGLTRT
ncbi:MAG TPA: hypothetical protein VJX67_01010 [Blastocatellia bacterium]|nr:hypothetical protein [Blastocatellia bacterium]